MVFGTPNRLGSSGCDPRCGDESLGKKAGLGTPKLPRVSPIAWP